MDNLTPEQRKKSMRNIKSKDTKIEFLLRKALWQKGYRYRKNYKKLIGKPDIVFIGKKIAIFCDSEFWHGYNSDETLGRIGTNSDYWIKKINRNKERDVEVNKSLTEAGWTVIRFSEKAILKNIDCCVQKIAELFASKENTNG